MLARSERASSTAQASSTSTRAWHVGGVVVSCLVLVAITWVAIRAQPRPPAVYLDDAWPLIGWKVDRLIDFRRAAYTSFGFVALERLWLELVSFSTVHARWLPMLFTLAIAPWFLVVALWMRIRYAAAILGSVLLLTSPELISMATHVKQYSFDVVLSITLLGLAVAIIRVPDSRRVWAAFIAASLLAMFGSFATVGIVAAGAVAGLVALIREPGIAQRTRLQIGGAVAALGLFAIAWYGLILSPVIPFDALNDFWENAYLDHRSWARSWKLVYLLFQAAFSVPVMISLAVLGGSTALVIARRPLHALLFAIPMVIAVAGSFMHRIPLGAGRTDTWFYAPMVFMVVTAIDIALEHADASDSRRSSATVLRRAGLVIRGLVVGGVAVLVLTFVAKDFPGGFETYGYGIYRIQPNVQPLITPLEAQRRAGDLVVVADTFTFSYPLYAPQGVTTEPTDANVAGWYPVLNDVNVLMNSVTPDPPAELAGRLDGVRNVFLLDAPRSFRPLRPEIRAELTARGFEVVSNVRAPGGLLQRWQRPG